MSQVSNFNLIDIMNLDIGNTLTESYHVTPKDLISDIDPSLPNVLGTYTLVKWAEITSGRILYNELPEDKLSVGMKIEIKHTGISLENAKIDVHSTISSIKGPMIGFDIIIKEGEETIAKLTHLRAILPKEKLQQKIEKKQTEK